MERFYKQFGDEKVFSLEYDKQTLFDLCLDYQERLERLKELYKADLEGWKEQMYELQQRIDKAIKYIEKEMFMYDNIEAEREDLLKILKGE